MGTSRPLPLGRADDLADDRLDGIVWARISIVLIMAPPSEPAGPATSVSVSPGVLKTVESGIQQDVVAPMNQAMRAADPDAGIPANALGQSGAAALRQYYLPVYTTECENLRQGWRSAGSIAETFGSCTNTYTSTETDMTDYSRQSGSHLESAAKPSASDYSAAEQQNTQAGVLI